MSRKKSPSGYPRVPGNSAAGLGEEQSPPSPTPRIAAVFATRGRPDVVAATVRHFIATQTLQPASVIVSCAAVEDAGDLVSLEGVKVVFGPPGLAAQRNTALDHLESGTEIVAFFDDDFVADGEWLAAAAQVFIDESDVGGFTGHVIADGIKGPGIAFADAVSQVETADTPEAVWTEDYSPYGCNMAFRMAAIGDVRFDERLVLYGWLEDRDFGAAVAARGARLIKWSLAYGVHMGVKGGRVNGERLGYSQVINPLYMLKKGTISPLEVVRQVFRNVASNLVFVFRPEPYVDRRGRVKGNMRALADLMRGQLVPERAATLPTGKTITTVSRRRVDV